MKRFASQLVAVFGSFHLAVTVLVFMTLITWLGTLNQIEEGLFRSQAKYFESWIVVHHEGPFGIPLPGGQLLMLLLGVNLLVGGIVRMRRGVSTLGILITHLGILLLLISGAVKLYGATEGNLRLWPGDRGDTFSSFYFWEVEIREEVGVGDASTAKQRRYLLEHEAIVDLTDGKTRTLDAETWPFRLEFSDFVPNADFVRSNGPGSVEGVLLKSVPPSVTEEANFAGLRVRALVAGKAVAEAPLFGAMQYPFVFEVQGRKFGVKLQRKREKMPFSVRLDEFHHELYPNTNRPRVFASDVTVIPDGGKGSAAPTKELAKIEMNQPLRRDGYILFQASFGPKGAKKGDRKFSVFQVVRNPSDQWPLYACLIIALGLIVHFGVKLSRWMKAERKRAMRAAN